MEGEVIREELRVKKLLSNFVARVLAKVALPPPSPSPSNVKYPLSDISVFFMFQVSTTCFSESFARTRDYLDP